MMSDNDTKILSNFILFAEDNSPAETLMSRQTKVCVSDRNSDQDTADDDADNNDDGGMMLCTLIQKERTACCPHGPC